MTEREKVIKGLEVILEDTADMFYRSTIQDALSLLKSQTRTIEQFEREREQQMCNMPPMGGFHDAGEDYKGI